jgi:uncharacterized peroxidase-related enzyme
MVHGALLRSKFFSAEQVEAIVRDFRDAGLEPAEVAMMEFVEKITLNAYKVTPEDIDNLRGHGFSDAEILDIVLATAQRNFFSKTLDAIGAEPDAVYQEMEPAFAKALAVGRPFRGAK